MWLEGGEERRQEVRVRGRRAWEGTVRNLGCVLWTYQRHKGRQGESFLLMLLAVTAQTMLEWDKLVVGFLWASSSLQTLPGETRLSGAVP